MEVGNEDWFSSTYNVRYPLFYDAIRAEFPQLKIIASDTNTGGRPYDILDEHFYNSAAWFQSQQNHYDARARGAYKIFVGEYAAREGAPTGNLAAALGDATFLMGLEENSDLVTLSAFAPLWANVNGVQWNTDLIGFDAVNSYGSVSYYAQVMLANSRGNTVVSNTLAGSTGGLRSMVTRTGDTYYVTIVNVGATSNTSVISLGGVSTVWPTTTVTSLSGATGTSTNSITDPTAVVPVTFTLDGLFNSFSYTFQPYSLTIMKLTANNSALGAVPTVATAAHASASPVTTAATTLSVLGADAGGEAGLTYHWNTLGTPPAPVTFSLNDTNAAKNTLTTFTAAGTYQFQVTITNAGGKATTSTVTVVVQPTAASFVVSPSNTTLQSGSVVPFSASVIDQFGNPISQTITGLTWSILSGGGSLSSGGVYTAPTAAGSATIRATAPGIGTGTATVTIANNLIAWYEANQTAGTTLTDSSGHGNTASLSGSYGYGTGFIGNAVNLTGGAASLPAGIVSDLSDFTISTWINPTALGSWARIFDFGTGTAANMFLTVNAGGSNQLRFAITTNGGGGEQKLSGGTLPTNAWSHVAISLAGNVATLYLNGVAVATNTGMTIRPSDLGITTQNYIGDSQYTADPTLQASIDDFRIYGAGLSAAEVASIYTSWKRPTIATVASAAPSPVVGNSTNVSVLGGSVDGESSLTYVWSVVGTPPAPVAFDANGTNGAKNTIARFSASGTYTLKVTVFDAGGAAVTSSVNVTVTVTNVTNKVHDYLTAQNSLSFTFDRDVGTQPWASLISVVPTAGGAAITPTAITYNATTKTARISLPSTLADGNYRATLSKGTFLGSAATLDFFVLAGDFNRDRTVNFTDLLILAAHYTQTGATYTEGDVNYDGTVNFSDLLLFASQYGVTVAAEAAGASIASAASQTTDRVASDILE
ncbi:MAG: alpha-L-arabinofuranosidase C-terminal domain-containing protein [Tepidisphaeraceae bacterium]